MMDPLFKEYLDLASKNEDLKSEERVLESALNNLEEIKKLVIEKEQEFCDADSSLRGCGSVKDSLVKRSHNLIDHLVHYKCVIECLSCEILTMENNLINDDEYVHFSLIFREADLAILQAIKVNQRRNDLFQNMYEEHTQSCLSEIELKWRAEHQNRRKLISKLIVDQKRVVVDKTTKNLEQQQLLLNQRYQSINNLIKMSYNV